MIVTLDLYISDLDQTHLPSSSHCYFVKIPCAVDHAVANNCNMFSSILRIILKEYIAFHPALFVGYCLFDQNREIVNSDAFFLADETERKSIDFFFDTSANIELAWNRVFKPFKKDIINLEILAQCILAS